MSLVQFRPEAPYADLAHLVERDLAKVEVAGSSPVIRSKKFQVVGLGIFLSIAKAMVYHHALACISSPKVYIISRRSVYHQAAGLDKKIPRTKFSEFFGADYGDRTRHLNLGKVALDQMS